MVILADYTGAHVGAAVRIDYAVSGLAFPYPEGRYCHGPESVAGSSRVRCRGSAGRCRLMTPPGIPKWWIPVNPRRA